MPVVSVIIPNYNHGAYLKQRIESVLNQTFQDFEVIILDDCSSDDSREIIQNYRSNSHVTHVVFNAKNSGSTFIQWQKGIELSSGEYIWIAESDDWCEPTFLENIVPNLLSTPGNVIGYCQAYCVVGNEIKAQTTHPLLGEYVEGHSFIKNYMVATNSIYNASMAVWKKSAYERISHDFTNFKFCGDWLFWVEIAATGNVYISGRILDYFRKHDKDVSGNTYNTGYNFVEELKLLKAMKDKNLVEESQYHKEIARKYFNYKKRESGIKQEMRNNIKEWFAEEASPAFLYKNYIQLSLKYKGYQVLKLIINKYS